MRATLSCKFQAVLCAACVAIPQLTFAAPLAIKNGALDPVPTALAVSHAAATNEMAAEQISPSWHSSIPSGSPDLILLLRSGLTSDGDVSASSSKSGVRTERQLERYAENSMRADSRVQDLALSSNSVGLTYMVPGKFMGFSIMVPLRSEIASNGGVKVNYPWYGIFFSLDTNALTAHLKSAAQQVLALQPATSTGALSPSLQAELLADMYSLLKDGSVPQIASTSSTLASVQ